MCEECARSVRGVCEECARSVRGVCEECARSVRGVCEECVRDGQKPNSAPLPRSDGVMVQITAETMDALRQALREMKDFSIVCGKANQEDSQEQVHIQWLEDDHNFNRG